MDIASIGAALAGLKNAFDLTRTAVDARDDHKIALALQEVQNKLLSVTIAATDVAEKNAALIQELATARQEKTKLEQRVRDQEQSATENAQYALAELTPDNWAYVHKPSLDAGKRPHYLCSACFKQSKHAILKEHSSFGVVFLACPLCKNEYDSGRRYNMSF